MPRKPRSISTVSYFHIMTQGINKAFIFDNPGDIKHYIKLIYKLKSDYAINVVAYCIMNNHTHMLLKAKNIEELSAYMHRINTAYALYYNKKYKRVGPVFRDRFKSQDINSEKQMSNCIKYIFNNPVKAGICNNPWEYPYSNYFKVKDIEVEEYGFIECEEEEQNICREIVQKFLDNNNIDKKQLKKDKDKLKDLVAITKIKYGISYRKLAKEIEISKDVIRKL